MKRWVEPQIRDTVVDFVHRLEERTELPGGFSSAISGYAETSLVRGKLGTGR